MQRNGVVERVTRNEHPPTSWKLLRLPRLMIAPHHASMPTAVTPDHHDGLQAVRLPHRNILKQVVHVVVARCQKHIALASHQERLVRIVDRVPTDRAEYPHYPNDFTGMVSQDVDIDSYRLTVTTGYGHVADPAVNMLVVVDTIRCHPAGQLGCLRCHGRQRHQHENRNARKSVLQSLHFLPLSIRTIFLITKQPEF